MMNRTILAFLTCVSLAVSSGVHAASFKLGDVDMTLGGSARLDVGWQSSDYGDVAQGKPDSMTDFFLRNPGNSRVKIKAAYEGITGYAEIGLKTDNSVGVRHVYASYDLGEGRGILFGQTDTVFSELRPDQRLNDDLNLQGFGYLYNNRRPQVRYTVASGAVAFKVAIEEPRGVADEYVSVSGDHLKEKAMPAVAAAFEYKDGGISVSPSAFYQQFRNKANDDNPDTKDITVATYGLCLSGSVKADPATFTGGLWYGQNLSVFDLDKRKNSPSTVFGKPVADEAGNDIEDIDSLGGWAQVSLKAGPGVFRAGAGMQRSETGWKGDAYEDDISTMGAFVNYEYTVAKGFTVTPEIAYFDYGKDANKNKVSEGKSDLGSDTLVGVHLQYDF
ncbi:MAG TPA: hypothetical protein PLS81_02840 [Deltaproteobacteria bacterium]|nr:hypothetical protein [Deltaproteobacteria bacterium]HOM28377.1 hypothetical protein [Deltaproteobacteria bacterium]